MSQFQVIDRTIFMPSPKPGVGVMGGVFPADRSGEKLVSLHWLISRSDTADMAWLRCSSDSGRTWGDAREFHTVFTSPAGTGRRHHRGGYLDPRTNRFLSFWMEGVLATDHPLEGMKQWTMHYSISDDAGNSERFTGQVIHEGDEFNATHPIPGVWTGRNMLMMGDLGERPMTRRDGVIVVPMQSSPTGPDGSYHNPGGGLTYTDCVMLHGRWRSDGQLSWTSSQRIVGDPSRTTRGLIEPTIAELDDGEMLVVMRGSNDKKPEIPGYRWHARSDDGGMTWSTPEPWTFDDGTPMFSPSSCSQLLSHSSGALLWLGNISESNPVGNGPRYPLVIGQVDRRTGKLQRRSVSAIDTRGEQESPKLTLSNFLAREEPGSGDLLVYVPRFYANWFEGTADYTAHLWCYRVRVKA